MTESGAEFNYTRDVFQPIEQRMIADAQARKAKRPHLARQLAVAMLEAKAGVSGNFDGKEQMRRTVLMAEWIIARLPFHDLALIEYTDGLTDEQREDRYRRWLRAGNARLDPAEEPHDA
jgi:hypothetical protein